jgi:hypothetical protein
MKKTVENIGRILLGRLAQQAPVQVRPGLQIVLEAMFGN